MGCCTASYLGFCGSTTMATTLISSAVHAFFGLFVGDWQSGSAQVTHFNKATLLFLLLGGRPADI